MSNDATGPAESAGEGAPGAPVPPPAAPQPPAGGPSAPAYGQPSGAPGYAPQTPPPGTPPQYGQQPGYGAQPAYGAAPVQPNITLNLWLSVFFGWIPALIFFIVEKDKVAPNYQRANAANLNFQIVLAIGYTACMILSVVLIGLFLLPLVSLAQLIIGIIHAVNVPNQLANGQEGKFYLAPNWVK